MYHIVNKNAYWGGRVSLYTYETYEEALAKWEELEDGEGDIFYCQYYIEEDTSQKAIGDFSFNGGDTMRVLIKGDSEAYEQLSSMLNTDYAYESEYLKGSKDLNPDGERIPEWDTVCYIIAKDNCLLSVAEATKDTIELGRDVVIVIDDKCFSKSDVLIIDDLKEFLKRQGAVCVSSLNSASNYLNLYSRLRDNWWGYCNIYSK